MHALRIIFAIAWNDLRVLSRDRVGIFFMVGFPILMGLFFSFLMGNGGGENSELRIAFVDEDGSSMSRSFRDGLSESGGLKIEPHARDEAIQAVRQGKLLAAAILPKEYGATAGLPWRDGPAVEVVMDPSRKAEAGMLQGLILQAAGKQMMARFQDPATFQSIIDDTQREMDADESTPLASKMILRGLMGSLSSLSESLKQVRGLPDNQRDNGQSNTDAMRMVNVKFTDVTQLGTPSTQKQLLGKIRSSWDLTFPQSSIWGVLACSAGFATLLVRERERGTRLRLSSSPVTFWQLLAGKGLACFIAICFVVSMMSCVAYGMGMRPKRWDLLVMAIVAIGCCFVGVMTLVSNLGRTEKAVSGAAWGCNMILAMFGGGMIPLAFMSGTLQKISHLDPVKWAVLSLEGAVWRDFTFAEMLLPLGVLVGIGAVAGFIGLTLLTRGKQA